VDILDHTSYIFFAFCRIEKMDCPCGLTRFELNTNHLVGSNGRCTAEDTFGNPCGRRLSDHSLAPPGKNILLLKINLSFSFSLL
jgi:hypothetical protein